MTQKMKVTTEDLFKTILREEEISLDFGFYWETLAQIIEQVRSECLEVKEAYDRQDKEHLKEEIGDLIHATISLSVFCGHDPIEALKISTDKYQERLKALINFVKQDGLDNLKNQSMKTLLAYWDKAKIAVAKGKESSQI